MGILDFIKDAGAKLFGVSEAKAATPDDIKKSIQEMGLNAEGLNVSVEGDKVTVSGTAASTEDAEKIALAVGNTVGVAKVDNQLQAKNATAESTFYTVKKGDTLWKIAEMHYGKGQGAKYTEIVKANTPPVKNPDLIQPGWVLRIPPLN
jgi:nucleoid-associated protein YgaU